MLPQFFDIHAHVNDSIFDQDRNAVFSRMQEKGVWAIQVGTDLKSSQQVAMMASFVEDGIYASIGIHPIDERNEIFREPFFAEIAKSRNVVAVGECGLDYSRLADVKDIAVEKERQRELFESDKKLADAHRDILSILTAKKKTAGDGLRGNVHFFSQTIDIAREYFALDFTISFTGVITFSHEYDEVVRLAPLDRIMSETDCPYVTPVPHRGKRNEPIFVEEIVKKIAEIRGEDFETVRKALVQNALRTFSIKIQG
jgi:TatD DNase family protein